MYTYDNLRDDIGYLAYHGVVTGSIGNSLYGNPIYYVKTGHGNESVIVTAAIHARENVTAYLVMRQIYRAITEDLDMNFYFLPMINPDGALLFEKGLSAAGSYAPLIAPLGDLKQWKANGRAVDLNVNFDAKFGCGRGNVTYPSSHGYIGTAPFSEPETAALRDFTLKVRPVFTVSYHALGREVYWEFKGGEISDRLIASGIADYLGYKLVDGELGSAGGYKDWCVTQGIKAITVEVGSDKLSHPADEKDIEEDTKRNLGLPKKITELYHEFYEGGAARGIQGAGKG